MAEAAPECPSSAGASVVPLVSADLDHKQASSSPTNNEPEEPKPVENKELESDKEPSQEISTPTAAVETKSMSPAEQEAVVKDSQEEGPPRRGRPKKRSTPKPRKAKITKEKKPKAKAAPKAKAKAKTQTKSSKTKSKKGEESVEEKKATRKKSEKKKSKAASTSGNDGKDSGDAEETHGSNSAGSSSKEVPVKRVRGKKPSKKDEVAQPAPSSEETQTCKPKTAKRTFARSAEKKAELSRKSCAYKKAKTKAAKEGLPEEECIKLAKKVAQQFMFMRTYVNICQHKTAYGVSRFSGFCVSKLQYPSIRHLPASGICRGFLKLGPSIFNPRGR